MGAVRDGIVQGIVQVFVVGFTAMLVLVLIFAVFMMAGAGLGAGMGSAAGPRLDGMTTTYVHQAGTRGSRNKLLALRVRGIILGSAPRDRSSSIFLGDLTYGYDIQRALDEAAGRDEVKGVLLHIETPGGTIFGSRAIHDGVVEYRRASGKPVVVYIEGLSASGGVMAMVGADRIYADHGSLVGSIGILGPQLIYYDKPVAVDGGLFGGGITTQGGIEQTIISAGRGKDLGNPFRRPTEEEVAVLTRAIDAEYASFVRHVAEHRSIDEATVRDRMGAHVFDNTGAEEYGLIDGTRNRKEAVRELATLAELGDDFEVVRPREADMGIFRQILLSEARPSIDTAGARREVLREVCAAALRYPLAYYGDPAALCAP